MKRAFTLIELIVVVAILGILMATLAVSMAGGTESARATQCQANMKSLASGVMTYLGSTGRYPLAGSVECMRIDDSAGVSRGKVRELYYEVPGWISWDSQGAYCGGARSHTSSESWFTSAYNAEDAIRLYALTNGALWTATSGSVSCYRCPAHKKAVGGPVEPNWSYVMNARFGWDWTMGRDIVCVDNDPRTRREHISRADKILLFAELPWSGYTGTSPNNSSSSGIENDCVLQYKDCAKGIGEAEGIGFNHKSGKDVVAHVVFADGHTERIIWYPGQDVQDLTKWLCEGKDIQYNASAQRYEESK